MPVAAWVALKRRTAPHKWRLARLRVVRQSLAARRRW
jgi:hypothetical protein